MITRVLIADDEPLARERSATLVRRHAPEAEIREVGDGGGAVETIRAWKPDALLLDVQMPARDGFGVVRELGADHLPPTIFVTAHDAYALRAFEVAALDYLLKPFDDERFAVAWRRLVAAHATGTFLAEARRLDDALKGVTNVPEAGQPAAPQGPPPLQRLLVTARGRSYVVKLEDVRWFESAGNYVAVHATTGRHLVRETLASLERRLDPARFVRIHRRRVVAVDGVREVQPWFAGDSVAIMIDGAKLRVSRTHRERFLARLAGRLP